MPLIAPLSCCCAASNNSSIAMWRARCAMRGFTSNVPSAWIGILIPVGRSIAAATSHVTETGNFGDRRIRIRRCGQLCAEHEFRHTHCLVDEDLFLFLRTRAPLQNRFDRDDGRFELKNSLEEQCGLEGRWRI